jgi:hypothetical protein
MICKGSKSEQVVKTIHRDTADTRKNMGRNVGANKFGDRNLRSRRPTLTPIGICCADNPLPTKVDTNFAEQRWRSFGIACLCTKVTVCFVSVPEITECRKDTVQRTFLEYYGSN